MLNTIYRLREARQFEIAFENMEIDSSCVIVRPTYLSICNADQRYYQGARAKEILEKKLPMALIHEGIGEVIFDPTGTFRVGTEVVIVPNLPAEQDPIIQENYLRSSKFRASNEDGFLQEYIFSLPDRLVVLPKGIDKSVAAFTEMVSVCFHAINRFLRISHSRREVIGVWGDGNLGYITALLLKTILKNSRIIVFGKHYSKLSDFTFVDEVYLIEEIPSSVAIDHAFECVGSNASQDAISQVIDCIQPEGTISIMGVSEYFIPINTRMILEKGLRVIGNSRSGRDDFVKLIELYKEHPNLLLYLENIVGSQIVIKDVKDIRRAFEEDIHKMFGKTIMVWDK